MSTSKCLVPCRHAHRSVVLFSVPHAFARSSLAQGTIPAKNLPLVEIANMAAYMEANFLALWVTEIVYRGAMINVMFGAVPARPSIRCAI